MFTSPHPKLSAIFVAIAALACAAKAMFDGDPATNPDWSQLTIALGAAYGLFSARQNGVTSEMVTGQVSAPPKP